MADPDRVPPKKKTTPRGRVAQCVRLFGAAERGVKVAAWNTLEHTMASEGFTWSDFGNWIDDSENQYTEKELQEYGAAMRREGVEAGIAIGLSRKAGNGGNGYYHLPKAFEMAEFCHDRFGQLSSDWQRDFVTDIFVVTRRGVNLSRKRLANLAKLYIENGGDI